MGNQPKYAGSYKVAASPQSPLPVQVNSQKQFVVVCGNINYGSVVNFLYDFYHPAREDVNCEVSPKPSPEIAEPTPVQVVILNKNEPDLEFEGLLKREKIRVKYFQVGPSRSLTTTQGTMLNPLDLQRVVVEKAAAVLVLCDKFSKEPCK